MLIPLGYRIVLSPEGERLFEEWAWSVEGETQEYEDLMFLLGMLYGEGRALCVHDVINECWRNGVIFEAEYYLGAKRKGLVGVYPRSVFDPPGFVYGEFTALMSARGEQEKYWSRKGRMLDILGERGLA